MAMTYPIFFNISLVCFATAPVFDMEHFGDSLLHFVVPPIPWLSGRPSFSEIFYRNLFLTSCCILYIMCGLKWC